MQKVSFMSLDISDINFDLYLGFGIIPVKIRDFLIKGYCGFKRRLFETENISQKKKTVSNEYSYSYSSN